MISGKKHFGSGTDHYIRKHISSILMIPLVLWFIIHASLILCFADEYPVSVFFYSPWNTTVVLVMLFLIFYHGTLLVEEILIDYIQNISARRLCIYIIKAFCMFTYILSALIIVKVHYNLVFNLKNVVFLY